MRLHLKTILGLSLTVLIMGCETGYNPSPEEIAAAEARKQADIEYREKVAKIATSLNQDPNSNNAWVVQKNYSNQSGYAIFKGPGAKFYAIDVKRFEEGKPIQQLIESNIAVDGLVYTRKTEFENDWRYEDRSGSFCPSSSSCSTKTDSFGNTYYTWSERVDFVKAVEKIYYVDPKNGIEFTEGTTVSKDLEAVAGALEEENLATVRDSLVSQFGLSETRASELASMASSMKNIADSQGRALTERDLESLQVKAMGATLSDLKKAKANGDTKAIESMTAKAAQMNKISPEQAKRLLKQLGL